MKRCLVYTSAVLTALSLGALAVACGGIALLSAICIGRVPFTGRRSRRRRLPRYDRVDRAAQLSAWWE